MVSWCRGGLFVVSWPSTGGLLVASWWYFGDLFLVSWRRGAFSDLPSAPGALGPPTGVFEY